MLVVKRLSIWNMRILLKEPCTGEFLLYCVFLIHTLRYQVTFAYSCGHPYIIRVTSPIRKSKRNKRAFRKFTSSSVHECGTYLSYVSSTATTYTNTFEDKFGATYYVCIAKYDGENMREIMTICAWGIRSYFRLCIW